MPEVGGKSLAAEFAVMIADAKKEIEDTKTEVRTALTEFMNEARSAKEAAKQLRAEAADMRQAFGAVLGNAPPQTPQQLPDTDKK